MSRDKSSINNCIMGKFLDIDIFRSFYVYVSKYQTYSREKLFEKYKAQLVAYLKKHIKKISNTDNYNNILQIAFEEYFYLVPKNQDNNLFFTYHDFYGSLREYTQNIVIGYFNHNEDELKKLESKEFRNEMISFIVDLDFDNPTHADMSRALDKIKSFEQKKFEEIINDFFKLSTVIASIPYNQANIRCYLLINYIYFLLQDKYKTIPQFSDASIPDYGYKYFKPCRTWKFRNSYFDVKNHFTYTNHDKEAGRQQIRNIINDIFLTGHNNPLQYTQNECIDIIKKYKYLNIEYYVNSQIVDFLENSTHIFEFRKEMDEQRLHKLIESYKDRNQSLLITIYFCIHLMNSVTNDSVGLFLYLYVFKNHEREYIGNEEQKWFDTNLKNPDYLMKKFKRHLNQFYDKGGKTFQPRY